MAGDGFGHSTRSKEIIRHLIAQGNEVLVFTYGQALFFLDEEFEVFEVPGFKLSFKENQLVYWRTIFKNTKKLFDQSKNLRKVFHRAKGFKPDLVITDFEPLAAFIAKLLRLPLISIDNMHQLTNTKVKLPGVSRNSLLTNKLVIKSMVWGADYYFLLTFFDTPVKKANTLLFSPVIRREVRALQPEKQDYILVYQNSNFKHLVELLKKINCRFVVFGLNKDGREGNLEFKNYSSREWLEYLKNCRAIIGTAGFSLISEALYLKKPYFALPIKHQLEQVMNAYYLQQAGYGDFAYRLTASKFDEFIANLPKFEKNLSEYEYHGNQALFNKLDETIKELVK